jgi:hypothetical protein
VTFSRSDATGASGRRIPTQLRQSNLLAVIGGDVGSWVQVDAAISTKREAVHTDDHSTQAPDHRPFEGDFDTQTSWRGGLCRAGPGRGKVPDHLMPAVTRRLRRSSAAAEDLLLSAVEVERPAVEGHLVGSVGPSDDTPRPWRRCPQRFVAFLLGADQFQPQIRLEPSATIPHLASSTVLGLT